MNLRTISGLVGKKTVVTASTTDTKEITLVPIAVHAVGSPALELDRELGKGIVSVIRVVELLIEHAHQSRASDVHLDPLSNGMAVRLRVDGVLQETHHFPTSIQNEIMSRIKILCGMRTDEHQAAQDGRFRALIPGGDTVDVRVSIVPTYHGENGVMRLLSGESQDFSLESLGFTPENRDKILRAIKKPYGMILATGPTGSGKNNHALHAGKNAQSTGHFHHYRGRPC